MRLRLRQQDRDGILKAGEIVRKGGVIVYPTDTVYGIGGDPLRGDVVRRILEIKRREKKPMPVLVSGIAMAEKLVSLNAVGIMLAEAFWPGGLTIVAEKRQGITEDLTMGMRKLGVRMPGMALTLGIIEASGGALIGTSANISGRPPARSVEELDCEVERVVDLVVDGGRAELGVQSTVVEISSRRGDVGTRVENWQEVRILREGAISTEVIRSFLTKRLGGQLHFAGL